MWPIIPRITARFLCFFLAGLLGGLPTGRACAQATSGAPAPHGPDGPVELLVVQPDGGVLVAGRFAHYAGQARPGLARLRPDGHLDPTFVPPAEWNRRARPRALAALPGGRVAVGMAYDLAPDSAGYCFLAQLLPDGRRDPGFAPAVLPEAELTTHRRYHEAIIGLALQPDGRLVVAGAFDWPPTEDEPRRLLRLLPNGHRDTTFQAPRYPPEHLDHLALRSDGRVAVTHCCRRLIECFRPDGRLDSSFAPRERPRVALPPGQPLSQADVAFILQTDSLPQDWRGGIPAALAAGPAGTLLVAGRESSGSAAAATTVLVRLLPNGRRDPTFTPVSTSADNGISALLVRSDGGILLAYTPYKSPNNFDPSSPLLANRSYRQAWQAALAHERAMRAQWQWLRRWLPTGLPDTTFRATGEAPNGPVRALAYLPDGRLLVGGSFTCYNGQDVPYLVCLRPDGRPDPAWSRHTR